MADPNNPDRKIAAKQSNEPPKASPSGATDKTTERKEKFDEEGGDQPQAPSQHAADQELRDLHDQSRSEQPLHDEGP
jgi:hypothetical protein